MLFAIVCVVVAWLVSQAEGWFCFLGCSPAGVFHGAIRHATSRHPAGSMKMKPAADRSFERALAVFSHRHRIIFGSYQLRVGV